VDAPVPEMWPSALQNRPDGNRPLRVRLGLVVSRPVWKRAESPVRSPSDPHSRDDERRPNVPIGREKMGNRRTGRRAGAPSAYGLWQEVLFDLRQAERALALIEEAGPDPERAQHLAAIRTAREQLETFR
jgi:hypothetical protein